MACCGPSKIIDKPDVLLNRLRNNKEEIVLKLEYRSQQNIEGDDIIKKIDDLNLKFGPERAKWNSK